MPDDLPYWTAQRRELLRWISDRAPSFAEGYAAAVTLLHRPDFPARVHLICHIIRDIYRYLPAALGMSSLSNRNEVFPSKIKKLVAQWDKFPPTEPSSSDPGSHDQVSPQVYSVVLDLVETEKKLADQPSVGQQLAIALFLSLERREDDFIHPRIIDAFHDEFKFFVSRAHLARAIDKVPTDDGLTERFESFERSFHSLVGPYFSGKEELDAILQDTNPKPD